MKTGFAIKQTNGRKQQGMALIETLAGIASVALVSLGIVYTSGGRGQAEPANAVYNVAAETCSALDQLTADIRRSAKVVSFSPSRLVLACEGSEVTYNFDAAKGTLTHQTAGSAPSVVLARCEKFQFAMYKPGPTPTGFAATAVPAEGKSVSVAWTSSRKMMGQKVRGADLAETMIVLRPKQAL